MVLPANRLNSEVATALNARFKASLEDIRNRVNRGQIPDQSKDRGSKCWTNWAGNQNCEPVLVRTPTTTEEVVDAIEMAHSRSLQVRPVGAGHSFSSIACSDSLHLDMNWLSNRTEPIRIDHEKNQVTVQPGIHLDRLTKELSEDGLSMISLGDVVTQSVAGAVSSGTHGTGIDFGVIATQVAAFKLVTATGDVIEASPHKNAHIFKTGLVGLGALGVLVEATIDVLPAFNLHMIHETLEIGDVLDNWLDLVGNSDHFEFFWTPRTDKAITKRSKRTDENIRPLSRAVQYREEVLAENVALETVCRLGVAQPGLIPTLAKLVGNTTSDLDYIDESHKVYASVRNVAFRETEYAMDLEAIPEAVEALETALIEADEHTIFPIEVRSAAADDIALSPAFGRPTGFIAVHRYIGFDHRPVFDLAEDVFSRYGARPHWGKLHSLEAHDLAPLYQRWGDFSELRNSCDPERLFSNDYIERVLGD